MRIVAISTLALAGLTGCVSLHAKIPDEVVRQHAAREEGIELPAICSLGAGSFSEGAVACMEGARMICDATGRWVREGDC